jgi:hypothetical protein
MKSWGQSKEYDRQQGHPGCERQDHDVEPHLVQSGNTDTGTKIQISSWQSLAESPQEPEAAKSQTRADHSASDRQYEAFGNKLTEEPESTGAERKSNCHLMPAGGVAGEQKICDIRAGDEQDHTDGGGQNQQCGFHGLDQLVLQSHHLESR